MTMLSEFRSCRLKTGSRGFASLDDRQERRAYCRRPGLAGSYAGIRDLIVTAENKIITPASVSPLGGNVSVN